MLLLEKSFIKNQNKHLLFFLFFFCINVTDNHCEYVSSKTWIFFIKLHIWADATNQSQRISNKYPIKLHNTRNWISSTDIYSIIAAATCLFPILWVFCLTILKRFSLSWLNFLHATRMYLTCHSINWKSI